MASVAKLSTAESADVIRRHLIEAFNEIESAGYPARKARREILEGRDEDDETTPVPVPFSVEEIGQLFLLATEAKFTAGQIAEEARKILEALPYLYFWPGESALDNPQRDLAYYERMSKEFGELAKQFDRQADDGESQRRQELEPHKMRGGAPCPSRRP